MILYSHWRNCYSPIRIEFEFNENYISFNRMLGSAVHLNIIHTVVLCFVLFCFDIGRIYLWPLLLTWFNFNPSMDKWLHPLYCVGWTHLSFPKLQRCPCSWSLLLVQHYPYILQIYWIGAGSMTRSFQCQWLGKTTDHCWLTITKMLVKRGFIVEHTVELVTIW